MDRPISRSVFILAPCWFVLDILVTEYMITCLVFRSQLSFRGKIRGKII